MTPRRPVLTPLLKGIDALGLLAARAGALCLAVLFLLGLGEIILRASIGQSLGITLEYSGYLVALSLFLGSGEALRRHRHIRVMLVRDHLSARLIPVLDLAASLIAFLISALLSYALIRYAIESAQWDMRSFFPTRTALWIIQFLFSLGPLVLTLALLARIIRLIIGEAEPPSAAQDQPS